MEIILLIKRIFQYLDLLIIFNSKIYYLKIEPIRDLWIIHQIYLLEEIPDPIEFKERIQYYTKTQGYERLNKQLSIGYLLNIEHDYHLMRDQRVQLHPDAIDLIKIIPILIKQLKLSSRRTNNG
jgi:hypothetical protein